MWTDIIFGYVCPTMGCIMSAAMFAAPVNDLREALLNGDLGSLNPLPWAFMSGNCVGWCAYGYYTHDPFILASNLPGLILSLWLNMGAAKLQYVALRPRGATEKDAKDENSNTYLPPNVPGADVLQVENDPVLPSAADERENYVVTPQEAAFLRILIFWAILLVWVGWVHPSKSTPTTLGLVVNVNLIFFYGAPLQAMQQVITEKSSDSIHGSTMAMNWVNTSFWMLYGGAKRDPIIFVPNLIGLLLGITQGVLYVIYPRRVVPSATNEAGFEPLIQETIGSGG